MPGLTGISIIDYTVCSWCPDQHGLAPPEAVGISLALQWNGQAVVHAIMRLKSPAAVDAMVAALLKHRKHVWPNEGEVSHGLVKIYETAKQIVRESIGQMKHPEIAGACEDMIESRAATALDCCVIGGVLAPSEKEEAMAAIMRGVDVPDPWWK